MSDSVSGVMTAPGRLAGPSPRGGLVRRLAKRTNRRLLCRSAPELSEVELRRPAIVFAPHFDDETLGCGGTIAKKRALGAEVKIVFLTDGTSSHASAIAADELASLRKAEGYAAAGILGVQHGDVYALDLTDSKLSTQEDEASQQVGELLRSVRPQDVFVPYRRDRLPDHVATHRIVMLAIERTDVDVTVYEYLIWFWHHWPWASLKHLPWRSRWVNLRDGARSAVGLLQEQRCRVRLSEVEQRTKRSALDEHRSQMSRLRPDADWPILSDVWGGDFLACCLQQEELFVRRDSRGGSATS